jgi:two-component system, chemotaxis family, CheB/CheR fusion protein
MSADSAKKRRGQQNSYNFPSLKQHYVVAIGASAGGLEAINEFFDYLPDGSAASFVIVQHLSPDHKSLMGELLAKHTTMTVSQAQEGMLLRANCVYLIPNKNTMTVRQGKLRLADKTPSIQPNLAIDIFFKSLAQDKGSRAIAIILSGTGSDGTRGLEAIKEEGGLVLVQDPSTAKFDGMPNSAIATGLTDGVLPPKAMPEFIEQHIVANERSAENAEELPDPLDNTPTLEEILRLTKENTSCDFTLYKRPTLSRRIHKRMIENGLESIDEYLHFVRINIQEIQVLCKEFLIGVTRFFRDQQVFELLKEKVLPELFAEKQSGETIKVWVVACSTGEEAYSLAMIFHEYMQEKTISANIKIFATDIDKDAIQTAARGIYPESISSEISAQRLERFFVRKGDDYSVQEHLRKMVIFAHHDVTKDAPFSRVDLVTCRNMLIYMDHPLQHKVLTAFHFALNLNGYLLLGPSENMGSLKQHFEEISRKWKIYKNIEIPRNRMLQNMSLRSLTLSSPQVNPPPPKPLKSSMQNKIGDIFSEAVVEEHGYAGICIDENFRLLHAIGDYRKYLDMPEYQLNFNLLKLLPNQLALALGGITRKAVKTNQKTILRSTKFQKDGVNRLVNVTVKPFLAGQYSERFLFVLFSEVGTTSSVKIQDFGENELARNEQLAALELELNETKENLFATFEELEVSNEELQSNNEELLSANEELQSTNEELQSLNEELHTVNTEHQQKIKELIELNDDLDNYFRNTDIGQMFVDQNLSIRKFTPAIKDQINLLENDIGRSLSHFSNNLKYNNLVSDIREVIETSEPQEKEIELQNGKHYLMKITPYLKLTNKPDGVVITFVDISLLKRLNNTLSGVLNSSLNGIMAFSSVRDEDQNLEDFEWILANKASGKLLQREAEHLIGKKLLKELPTFKKNRLFAKYVQVVHSEEPLHLEHFYQQDGLNAWFETVAVKMGDGLVVTFADITEKKIAEENLLRAYQELQQAEENLKKLNNELEQRVESRTRELAMSEERFRLISQTTNDAIWDWTLMSNRLWWSEGFKTMFSYTAEQIEPGVESWFKRIHPEDKDQVITSVDEAINSGQSNWAAEYRFLKADGSFAHVFNRAHIMLNENQVPYRMLGSLIDLSDLKQAQEKLQKSNDNLMRINNDLDNFIYTASHDLKSPIANIEGLVNQLEEEILPDNEAVVMMLDLIKKSIDRFKQTIRDLTDITKIQKELDSEITVVDLEEVIEDVKISIRNMILETDANIQIDCSECPEIRFSKKNLHSIIYNLLSNAIKYRHPDRPLEVSIKAVKEDGYSIIKVQDNGLGIEKHQLPKLFTMFKRLHDHVEGTGVGLYIVNKIVENANGKIEVDSVAGEGTTFKVYLKDALMLTRLKEDSFLAG